MADADRNRAAGDDADDAILRSVLELSLREKETQDQEKERFGGYWNEAAQRFVVDSDRQHAVSASASDSHVDLLSARSSRDIDTQSSEPVQAPHRSISEDQTTKGHSELATVYVECLICTDRFAFGEGVHTFCEPDFHHWCKTCFEDFYKSCLEGKFDSASFPPKCCGQPFDYTLVKHKLSVETQVLYEKKHVELSTLDRTYCSNTVCAKFIDPARISNGDATCGECYSHTCSKCKEPHHHGHCKDTMNDELFEKLVKENRWPSCPSCKTIIEKSWGCNHMSCTFPGCQAQFCYLCSALWKTCDCPQYNENEIPEDDVAEDRDDFDFAQPPLGEQQMARHDFEVPRPIPLRVQQLARDDIERGGAFIPRRERHLLFEVEPPNDPGNDWNRDGARLQAVPEELDQLHPEHEARQGDALEWHGWDQGQIREPALDPDCAWNVGPPEPARPHEFARDRRIIEETDDWRWTTTHPSLWEREDVPEFRRAPPLPPLPNRDRPETLALRNCERHASCGGAERPNVFSARTGCVLGPTAVPDAKHSSATAVVRAKSSDPRN